MITPSRYYLYSIAQYVHSRREERLNVGVVVFDPESGKIVPRFNPEHATRRIKSLYPEVDRKGLELYLHSLSVSLERRSFEIGEKYNNPLDALAAEWQNILRLTPARPVSGRSADAAAQRLLSIYLDDPEQVRREEPRGVERAKRRTLEAIRTVLGLDIPEMGYRTDYTFRVPFERKGKRYDLQRHFAFLVKDRFAVDAISLEAQGVKGPEGEAELFIAKARDLQRQSQGFIKPHATVSIDPEREDQGRSLIAYILERGELEEDQVVEADEAEVMMVSIREQLVA